MIKKFLRKHLPISTRVKVRRTKALMFGLESEYRGKTNAEVFDDIYLKGSWGKDGEGLSTSGHGSHDASVVAPYVEMVKGVIGDKGIKTIVDLGCGDFNIGRHFARQCASYTACDVSSVILDRNSEAYPFSNVEFRKLDLANDDLPSGDLAVVRQVLQHVSNADIARFVATVNQQKPFKFLLLTEHLPADPSFRPNMDKPAGPNIRVSLESGVVLHEPPFNLAHRSCTQMLEVSNPFDDVDAVIRTYLYEF